ETFAGLAAAVLTGAPPAAAVPGLHELAVAADGGVYAGAAGLSLAAGGDELLRLGRLGELSFPELLERPAVRAAWLAVSDLAQPLCSQCVFAPFCPRPSLDMLRAQGGLWGRMPENPGCVRLMGLLEHLFSVIEREDARQALAGWAQEPS
ncbi:MAG: hypothetical protein KGL53_08035, partial [Elusimicrobia bacterium]|nr:hypothetical protein [Elusimicrobiota bacterium]